MAPRDYVGQQAARDDFSDKTIQLEKSEVIKMAKKKPVKKKVKKVIKKKKTVIKKKKKATAAPSPTAGLIVAGEITHFFPHVNAGVIKLKKPLSVGDSIYIKGHTSDFKEKVESMQIDRVPVEKAKQGDEIGILVKQRVRIGDTVYKL